MLVHLENQRFSSFVVCGRKKRHQSGSLSVLVKSAAGKHVQENKYCLDEEWIYTPAAPLVFFPGLSSEKGNCVTISEHNIPSHSYHFEDNSAPRHRCWHRSSGNGWSMSFLYKRYAVRTEDLYALERIHVTTTRSKMSEKC